MLADEIAASIRHHWWLFLLRGLAAIVFGALALLWPGARGGRHRVSRADGGYRHRVDRLVRPRAWCRAVGHCVPCSVACNSGRIGRSSLGESTWLAQLLTAKMDAALARRLHVPPPSRPCRRPARANQRGCFRQRTIFPKQRASR